MHIRKVYILFLLLISFLWIDKVWAYNDACWEQQQSAFNINLAKEVQVEKTFSLSWLNSDNINTILSWYTWLDYVWKSWNSIFFIHDNKLKKAVYQNGIIEVKCPPFSGISKGIKNLK